MLRAVTGLKYFQQAITNFRWLQSIGFRGWDFATNPCQGWAGVTCDATGRVSRLCAYLSCMHACAHA